MGRAAGSRRSRCGPATDPQRDPDPEASSFGGVASCFGDAVPAGRHLAGVLHQGLQPVTIPPSSDWEPTPRCWVVVASSVSRILLEVRLLYPLGRISPRTVPTHRSHGGSPAVPILGRRILPTVPGTA